MTFCSLYSWKINNVQFEASKFSRQILKKIELSYGKFYFLKNVIVSEIDEGVVFDFTKAKPVIEEAIKFYGRNARLGYVSNRINTYSVAPQDWNKFYNERYCIRAMALVAYTPMGQTNIMIEQLFIKNRVERFNSLEFAVHWIQAQLEPQPVEACSSLLKETA